jgi:ribosomal protein S10
MINLKIKLYSKNEKSIQQFYKLLQHWSTSGKNIESNFQLFKTKKKRKKIAILKSPHVNKKAQEHFQIITYIATIHYFSWDVYKSLLFIKKIKNFMFSGLKIKIERKIYFKTEILLKKLKSINNNKAYKLFSFKQQQKLLIQTPSLQNKELLIETLQYLKNLDTYGIFMQKTK